MIVKMMDIQSHLITPDDTNRGVFHQENSENCSQITLKLIITTSRFSINLYSIFIARIPYTQKVFIIRKNSK